MKVFVSFPTVRNLLFESSNKEPFCGRIDGQILYVWDTIDDEMLSTIIDHYGTPKYIFMDSASCYQSKFNNVYFVDAWLEAEILMWEKNKLVIETSPIITTHIANFQINKKQINRFLTIKLCEIFDVVVDYTWSGIGSTFDLSYIIAEKQKLNDHNIDLFWNQILSPIHQFDKKWIDVNDKQIFTSSVVNYGKNYQVWNAGLNKIMSSTAVSLITESVWTQTAATFSEKTAFSLLALTFPIWIGGYNMATEWKNKGFDIFDDIIDHSYERMPTLLERCFYAFYLNKDILTDVALAKELRSKHMDRLVNNRDRLTSDNLKKYNRKIISTWPEELQQPALESMHRNLKLK